MPDASLPVVTVAASTQAIVERLETAARRGRLAGFEPCGDGPLFKVTAHGSPFEGEVLAHAKASDGGGTTLTFTTRMHRKLLWVFIAVLAVSIWPGMPITKSLLASLLPSWDWLWGTIEYWYLPLSIIGSPWAVWTAVSRSRKEIAVSAVEMVGKVQKELAAHAAPKGPNASPPQPPAPAAPSAAPADPATPAGPSSPPAAG